MDQQNSIVSPSPVQNEPLGTEPADFVFSSKTESSSAVLSEERPGFDSNPPPPNSPISQSGYFASAASSSASFSKKKTKSFFLIFAAVFLFLGIFTLIITVFAREKMPSQEGIFSRISFLKEKVFSVKETTPITYWGLFEPPAVFQQVIEDYEKSHPGVKINYVQENLKLYRERLQAALERGEGPDIFRIHQTWIPMFGKLLSPIPQTIYNSSSFEQTFYPSAKETLKYEGQYVAIPLMFDGLALYYNEDIFRAKGKTPPKTWGELKTLACELTVRDDQGKLRTAGVALGTANNVDHWSDILGLMMLQNGASLANPAACTKNPNGEDICLGRDALTFYTLFVTDQICADEGINVGAVWSPLLPTSTYFFATGNLAMYFGPSWRVFDIKSLNNNLNFKVVSVPQLPGGNVSWSSYWVEAVSRNSKHSAEAWNFLQYLSSERVLQKLYQTESSLRLFGEPYPRLDMASQLKAEPIVGPFVEQAPFARSWYLASSTADETGLNSQIIKYYEDAVNLVNKGGNPLSALTTAAQGIAQVLNKYGVTR